MGATESVSAFPAAASAFLAAPSQLTSKPNGLGQMVERYIQLPGHHSGGRVAHRNSGGVGLGDAVSR